MLTDKYTIFLQAALTCFLLAPPVPASARGAASAPSTQSAPQAILRAIRADAWAVLAYTPTDNNDSTEPAPSTDSALNTASAILSLARQVGLLNTADPTKAAWIEVVTALPMVTRFPFAICLFEGQAKPLESGGFRLDRLSAALLIRTAGNDRQIKDRIQHLLNTYVNNQVGRIESFRAGRYTGHRLIDERLPDWCTLQWGTMGKNYVIALGQGTFQRLAAVRKHDIPALTDDAWFSQAARRCLGQATEVFVYLNFDAINQHLEPVMVGKPQAVLEALGLAQVDRGLWAFGKTGRAVQARALLTSNGIDELTTLCASAQNDAWVQKVIPAQATQYAVLEKSPAQVVRLIRDGYLAARSPSVQERLRSMWSRVETETDINVERDLLEQLGQRLVIHNYPPHPLGIPVARTIVAQVTGSAMAVRLAVDRLMRRWQREFEPQPDEDWSILRLHRADDGLWFFQAGLYGPALVVTDRWLVISYSPMAVRQNLALLEPPAPDAAADVQDERPGP